MYGEELLQLMFRNGLPQSTSSIDELMKEEVEHEIIISPKSEIFQVTLLEHGFQVDGYYNCGKQPIIRVAYGNVCSPAGHKRTDYGWPIVCCKYAGGEVSMKELKVASTSFVFEVSITRLVVDFTDELVMVSNYRDRVGYSYSRRVIFRV